MIRHFGLLGLVCCQTPATQLSQTRELLDSQYSFAGSSNPPLMTDSWLSNFYSHVSLPTNTPGVYDDMKLSDTLVNAIQETSYSANATNPLWAIWSLPVRFAYDKSVDQANASICIKKVFAESILYNNPKK